VKPYLDLWVLPDMCGGKLCRENGDGMAEHAFSYTQPTDQGYFTARIDHNFSDKHSFFGRWTFDDADRRFGFNTVNWIQAKTRAHYWTLEEKSIFTPKLLNVIRYSFIRTHQVEVNDTVIPIDPSLWFLPEDQQLGGMWINGSGGVGSSVLSPTPTHLRPQDFVQNLFHFSDGLTYNAGMHTWKMGADIRRYQYNGLQGSRLGGRYQFRDFEDFLRAGPRGLRQWIMGFYVEDDVQLRPNLTLNVGLRYEFITVPSEVNGKISNLRHPDDAEITFGNPYFSNPSERNFAPRIGFSWDPFGDGRTAIRSAFGVFHALVDLDAFRQPLFSTPPAVRFVFRTRDFPDGQIPFPDPLAKGIPPGSFSVWSVPATSIKQPYLMKWNLDLQREIFPGTLASMGYIGSRGVALWTDSEHNICFPDFSADGKRFFREGCDSSRNPNFATINVRKTPSSSFYHALFAKANRRFSNNFALQVAYTFSKSIDDESGYRLPGQPGVGRRLMWQGTIDDQQAVRGLSDFDVRNNFVASGSWFLPGPQSGLAAFIAGGWQLNGILTLSDGYPVSPTISAAWNFDDGFSGVYLPDLVPGGDHNPVLGGPDQYFDVTQFAPPQEVTDPSVVAGCGPRPNRCRFYGNLGRNTLIAAGVATLDFSLMKKWPLALLGEEGNMMFRAEFFNLFNRANFAGPSLQVFNSRGTCCGNAGRILRTTTTARQIQLALRMTF